MEDFLRRVLWATFICASIVLVFKIGVALFMGLAATFELLLTMWL